MDNILYIKGKLVKIINKNLKLHLTGKMTSLDLRKDLKADSVDYVNIITEVEKSFQVVIKDDQMKKLRTIDNFIEYVVKVDSRSI